MAITPISATEVAQIERRLAMAEGRIGFLARLVAQAASKQIVAPVPWDPHWLLSCFPRLGMRRGRQLAGYLVACPGNVRAIHVLSRGEPPYDTRWLERQITRLEWAPWAGGCPTEWPTPLTPFLDTGLCLDDSPAGWWQRSLFLRRLCVLGCVGAGLPYKPGAIMKSSFDLAGRRWQGNGKRPSCWLPTVRVADGEVSVRWHERIAQETAEEVRKICHVYVFMPPLPKEREETLLLSRQGTRTPSCR